MTPPEDWPVRLISFPVAGPVTYYDDWGACRGGPDCPRRHIGNDVIGRRLQPLLAATDGVVSHLVLDHPTAGWGLVITDAEGWDYRYYHVNNDTPGTDDGSDPPAWRLAAGIAEGVAVKAGQVVAYLGDSGNSELSVPHLHFEIHRPDGSPIDPYRSLRFSEWTARCSVAAPGVAEQESDRSCRRSTPPWPTPPSSPRPAAGRSCSAWTGPCWPRAMRTRSAGAATRSRTRPARHPHPRLLRSRRTPAAGTALGSAAMADDFQVAMTGARSRARARASRPG